MHDAPDDEIVQPVTRQYAHDGKVALQFDKIVSWYMNMLYIAPREHDPLEAETPASAHI